MADIFVPLSNSTANKIAEMIFLQKRFNPCSKIPNEMQLAEELNVSRTSIREAVKILIAKGILEIRRGKGTFVTTEPSSSSGLLELSLLEDKRVLVQNWFEFRLIIEPESVRLATQRASQEELGAIELYEKAVEDLIRSHQNYDEADALFHMKIAHASHNSVIERMIPFLQNAVAEALSVARYIHADSINPSAENALIYHREILRYMQMKDAEGASIAMRYHIKRGMSDLDL